MLNYRYGLQAPDFTGLPTNFEGPITKRVYNLGLDEFFAWYGQEPRPGFTEAPVARLAPCSGSARLGAVSIDIHRFLDLGRLPVLRQTNPKLSRPSLSARATMELAAFRLRSWPSMVNSGPGQCHQIGSTALGRWPWLGWCSTG